MANTSPFFVRDLRVGSTQSFDFNSSSNTFTLGVNSTISLNSSGFLQTTGITYGNAVMNSSGFQAGSTQMNRDGVVTPFMSIGANCSYSTTNFSVGGVDNAPSVIRGASQLVRFYSDGTYGRVEAMNIAQSVYQPIFMGGSYTYIHTGGVARIYVDGTGKVGVGTAPSDNFHVAGNIVASGDITTSYSDERLKDHVFDLEDTLTKLKTLKGFAYVPSATCLKLDPDISADIKFGVSAQKVQEVYPELVSRAVFDRTPEGTSKTGENYLTVDYVRLVPVLLQAINELSDKYNQLQSQLDELKSKD